MSLVQQLGQRAKAASRVLGQASTEQKNRALQTAAGLLTKHAAEILTANEKDIAQAQTINTPASAIDRLRLTTERIEAMANGLRSVAKLQDPIGEIIEDWETEAGLHIDKVRVPLGVVAIIYENRPNVTVDAAGLCVKSGNAVILRGSSAAQESNTVLADLLREAMREAKLPEDTVVLIADPAHETAVQVMQLTDYVDCLIPRGGHSLVQSVRENATVPVIIDGDGNCHVYVDADADLALAEKIVVNSKTQRTSVCNAAESLVVHEAVAKEFLPRVSAALQEKGVELLGDETSRAIVDLIDPATEEDFGKEFLDLKMSVAVTPDIQHAIDHINKYGTGHTEAIVTANTDAIKKFAKEIDSAVVIVNASTRFTDGERFGFGAEIGISTQKLHARGPMALRELTTYKYVVSGSGQLVT